MRLREVLADVDVEEWLGDPHVEVSALVHDNHDARPGACFACIPGSVSDGHDYAPAAVTAGAVALLVERTLELPVSQARVRRVRKVLGPAAARFHDSPSRALRCLGVTGTNGKTTTTYLLEAIARAAGEEVGVIGTVGARIEGVEVPEERTTPEATELQALLAGMRDAGVATVAMEVSSHALDQHRVDGTWFRAVCFTNLSHEHLDYHGTLADYFEAKARLFDPTRTAAAAVNVNDPYGVQLAARTRQADLTVLTYSAEAHDEADLVAELVESAPDGNRFELVDRRADPVQRAPVRSPLVGRFNVANALAAAATALAGGLSFDAVVSGLENPEVIVPGRLERVDDGRSFTVMVDYAHTPDALAGVLDVAHQLTADGRVILVFGCGGNRDHAKRPLMGQVAAERADLTVVTSDNPRSEDPAAIAAAIVDGLRARQGEFVLELDRREAIRFALSKAQPGDDVVVAGRGHEPGQTIGAVTRPFDDRAVAREELDALRCA